ncbi:hypothetical protein F4861DRAFT_522557 [Xylaria intraflava]|nr:hypothetical protein F4861DRAFT_522557 [Xylaria intraflava]
MYLQPFRQSTQQEELARLANKHAETALEPADREALNSATNRLATASTAGSIIGLGLGIYASIRLRRLRTDMFAAFRAAEKPSFVVFPSGRQEAIPDTTPLMRPTVLGDIATFYFFGLGATLLGGETGTLAGSLLASRALDRDPASRERIEKAHRLLKADLLRKEAARLESGGSSLLI